MLLLTKKNINPPKPEPNLDPDYGDVHLAEE